MTAISVQELTIMKGRIYTSRQGVIDVGELTIEQVYRRAGGRRAYNRQRLTLAEQRRARIYQLLEGKDLMLTYGTQAALARRFNVSEATISRDLDKLRVRQAFNPEVPHLYSDEEIKRMLDELAEGLIIS